MVDIDIEEWGGASEVEELADGFMDGDADVIEHEATPGMDTPDTETAATALSGMYVRPNDPSTLGYPPTLPVEVALQTAPDDDIREAYGFTEDQWRDLKASEQFKSDLTAARAMLSEEGMSFKAKARLQAEELLKTSWKLIHDQTGFVPPSVKADLLKFTVKAAGLDASGNKDNMPNVTPLQINISL